MASMFTTITNIPRFASDAAGLEKTLRLLQGLSQIIIAYTSSPLSATPWLQARKQFALGRRYLRFFKFIPAFALASSSISSRSSTGLSTVLDVGKWSCLGMYLFLESCTILDAMEVYSTPWGPRVLLEANKFWFYSLLFSLAGSLLLAFYIPSTSRGSKAKSTVKSGVLVKKIVTDACDLLIPGSITGWARTSPAIVGVATVVSTVLGSEEIWVRVQSAAHSESTKGNGREVRSRRKSKM